MPALSGKYACAKLDNGAELDEVTGWEFTHSMTDESYASCRSRGKRRRVDGTEDATGSVKGVYNDDASIHDVVKIGDTGVIHLFRRVPQEGDAAATPPVPPVDGIYIEVPFIVLNVQLSADIDRGGPQPWTVQFGLNTTENNPEVLYDQRIAA